MNPAIYAAIGAGVAVAIFAVLAGMDLSSAQQLQFMTLGGDDFDFLTLSLDTDIAVCNPTGFTTSFEKIDSSIYYKDKEIGTFTINGDSFPAHDARDVNSRFSLDAQNALQIALGAMFAGFAGQDIDFNENDVKIVANIEKNILGVIPFSTSKTMTPAQSQSNFISGDRMDEWKCGWTPKMKQVSEDLGVDTSIPLQDYIGNTKQKTENSFETEFVEPSPQEIEAQRGHIDAVILVKIFGDKFDFSLPVYQLKSSAIYFSGDGHTIHTYPSSTVDIPYLFDTLGMELTSKCLVFQGGREFCSNNDYKLEFYLNGVKVDSLDNIPLANNDKILILYGSDQSLTDEFSELNSLRPIHRYR